MAFMVATVLILIAASSSKSAEGCFESIVSFGDSQTDTGNWPLLCAAENKAAPRTVYAPYGRTFFGRPTGCSSDGRLVIDFIAQSLGLPFVQPYIAGGVGEMAAVNFAVIGSTVLEFDFYVELGLKSTTYTNVSLATQLDWFKQYLATIPDGRPRYLQKTLIVLGEIGGNDYNHLIMQRSPGFFQLIQSLVPPIVGKIGYVIEEMIKLGAETLLVPGNYPIGCHTMYLSEFEAESSAEDYDPRTGCLNWLNDFAVYHNELLQSEMSRIRQLYPHVRLIYADYYNAAMQFYLAPEQFGFEQVLRVCCGTGGGKYNFNATAVCGDPVHTSCDDPDSYTCWDGVHFTEAGYRVVTQALLEGPYTIPHFTTVCPSTLAGKKTFAHEFKR